MKTLWLAAALLFSLHTYAFDLAEQEEFTGLPEESLDADVYEYDLDLDEDANADTDTDTDDAGFSPNAPGPGGMSCAAFARRREWHREGHRDCRSCERMHGDCYESCGRNQYRVEVVGEVVRFNDRVKVYRRFVATGDNRRGTEERAMRACRWARADRCHVTRVGVSRHEFRRVNCR